MTYQQALKKLTKTGVSKASPHAFLASICQSLAYTHCISPQLVYEGAVKKGLTAEEVAKLAVDNPVALGDLMFA